MLQCELVSLYAKPVYISKEEVCLLLGLTNKQDTIKQLANLVEYYNRTLKWNIS